MLLTRAPLPIARELDLHVLGLPPAFILSQDQTLKLNLIPLLLMSKDLNSLETCFNVYYKTLHCILR